MTRTIRRRIQQIMILVNSINTKCSLADMDIQNSEGIARTLPNAELVKSFEIEVRWG